MEDMLSCKQCNNCNYKGSLRCADGGFRDGEVYQGGKINTHGFIVMLMIVKTADIGRLTVPLQ